MKCSITLPAILLLGFIISTACAQKGLSQKGRQSFAEALATSEISSTERSQLKEMIDSKDAENAKLVVIRLRDVSCSQGLISLLDYPSDSVRAEAVRALGQFKSRAIAEALLANSDLFSLALGGTEAQIARAKLHQAVTETILAITGAAPKQEHYHPATRRQALEQAVRGMAK